MVKNKRQKWKFLASNFFVKNRRGWTKVLEVMMSILLLAAVVTLALSSGMDDSRKQSEEIYKQQALALKIVQLDDSLREDIFEISKDDLPSNSSDLNSIFPVSVNDSIKATLPSYLECASAICEFGKDCYLKNPVEKREIYAKSILITTDGNVYEPRILRLFCWRK